MEEINLNAMDDMHFHPRKDKKITEMVMQHLLESGFVRGIPIFNYQEPIDSAKKLGKEQERLTKIAPKFEFIWSVMLTKNTTPKIISDIHSIGAKVIKWIPEGLSTNSSKNGTSWENLPQKYPSFKRVEKNGMGVMIHVEDSFHNCQGNPITHPLFREIMAIPKFDKLVRLFPGIPFTFEHVSTKEGADYILHKSPNNVFATITAHHLVSDVSEVYKLQNGKENIVPDKWCMPIFKYWRDREALREAATSGNKKIFYGGDKAPHENKDPHNPPAGVYAGNTDVSIVAKIFEKYDSLDNFNNFMSGFGADRYGLPRNKDIITLRKQEWVAPRKIKGVKIFCGGKKMYYRVM